MLDASPAKCIYNGVECTSLCVRSIEANRSTVFFCNFDNLRCGYFELLTSRDIGLPCWGRRRASSVLRRCWTRRRWSPCRTVRTACQRLAWRSILDTAPADIDATAHYTAQICGQTGGPGVPQSRDHPGRRRQSVLHMWRLSAGCCRKKPHKV